MSDEKVIRLTPKNSVLRELYLISGNQCAYPGCVRPMIDSHGNFVGQICHIEAAMPGGERFNSSMSNEDRRKLSNLILMCHEHHIVTNNIHEYTVQRLKKIKKDHENKFSNIISKLVHSIEDLTQLQESVVPKTLSKMNTILHWGNTEDELLLCIDEINQWISRLRKLTPNTRKIFVIMLERSEAAYPQYIIPIEEIELVTNLTNIELRKHIVLLTKYRFISEVYLDEHGYICDLNTFDSGWEFWEELIRFSQKTASSLEEIIVNLDFSILD
ncbi:hypothetical protein ABWW58_06085 [Sporolactobacillus sp. STCC-11]|uniref:hypothetical protein n=1 Tax=Sporolactobacillus caesalpiniae TaxID=3230362 RepID=UPI003394BA85